MTWRVFLGASE